MKGPKKTKARRQSRQSQINDLRRKALALFKKARQIAQQQEASQQK